MVAFDREMLTAVAVIVCLGVCVYLFKELNSAKDDVNSLKNVSLQMMDALSRPPPMQDEEPEEEVVREIDEMSDKNE